MIRKPKFDELKWGDTLAIVRHDKLELFKYLSRDPGWEKEYCFLMHFDGMNASHYSRSQIENDFYQYDTYDEIKSLHQEEKAKTYRAWLDRYEVEKARKELTEELMNENNQ